MLSAAAQRHQNQRAARAGGNEKEKAPVAYIPTPDSNGLVDNYEELYPPNHWKDPSTYLRWSSTVEESITNGLNHGFVYYMDECDKEWLDKNNEQARGEGTSAQGAISSRSGHSQRSSKAKGKEPDLSAPVVMSEDEFELVMAVFEKVTHDKTEYLHHALENGMPFPPFTDYQDTFSASLPPSMFADFIAPSWLPAPPYLLRLARVVYPHWRERRLEAGGKRIIPTVNVCLSSVDFSPLSNTPLARRDRYQERVVHLFPKERDQGCPQDPGFARHFLGQAHPPPKRAFNRVRHRE